MTTVSASTFLAPREFACGPDPAAGEWRHWRLGDDADGVTWLLLDQADTRVNTLSEAVLRELDNILETLEGRQLKGLVLRSSKPAGFAVGADIGDFTQISDAEEAERKVREAHRIADRLEALKTTKVAILHGTCVGGGLELALACDRRIAIEGASFGFPEIRLGLHPGLGGTARATHLIDPTEAMKLMLTGKSVPAQKARALGLVDAVVTERVAEPAAAAAVAGELEGREGGLKSRVLLTSPARRIAASRMRSETEKRAPREHYPAPYALIDLWEEHGGDRAGMLREEAASFARLLLSETAQNLIRVFFLRETLKSRAKGDSGVAHVHVVGAGEMGGDIAAWCARQGFRVTLADMKTEVIADAVRRAGKLCEEEHLDALVTRDTFDRLIPDPRGYGVTRADLVIEAVPEDLEIKAKVYGELEPRMKEDALLATNTSSIPLDRLAEKLDRPERLVGLHFFNPVAKMPLVEVVGHEAAAEATLAAAHAFAGEIGKLPAPVASAPGFLVNRALMPCLIETLLMIDEGVQPEAIDEAAERFGMPVGPAELADRVGLDVALSVADMLRESLENVPEVPDWFRDMVEDGELGEKSGKGLYDWKDGKPKKRDKFDPAGAEAADRLILPLLNACVACLREKVVEEEDVVDAALVFGAGFAPFRGGPLAYARKRGTNDIYTTLSRLAERHGARFAPDPGWDRLG